MRLHIKVRRSFKRKSRQRACRAGYGRSGGSGVCLIASILCCPPADWYPRTTRRRTTARSPSTARKRRCISYRVPKMRSSNRFSGISPRLYKINIDMNYKGSLDIMRELMSGTTSYDAVWPPAACADDRRYGPPCQTRRFDVDHARVFGIRRSLAEFARLRRPGECPSATCSRRYQAVSLSLCLTKRHAVQFRRERLHRFPVRASGQSRHHHVPRTSTRGAPGTDHGRF